jgi:Ca-activated chloride channel homolog
MKSRAVQKPRLFSLILLIILACVVMFRMPALPAAVQNPGVPQPQQASSFAIRSSVDLVVLRATVRDHKGAPISGLARENFQVYEDKVIQQIESFSHEDVPVTIGLVIDNSGSMRPKRSDVISSAMAFVRSSNPDDQIFVVNFNEHVSMGLSANIPFTNNAVQLEKALSRNVITGMTALYDAIAAGLQQLQKGKWDKKVLIVVSDGGDNASAHKLAQVMSMVNQSNAIIYTMGIFDESDEDRNPHVLKQLSGASGGEAFFPASLQEILPICEQIAHDIRSQYTITFVPTNKKQDGAFRKIDVKAREASGGRRLSVITRSGYSAPVHLQANEGRENNRP